MSDYIKRKDAVRAVVDAKTGKDKTIDGTRQVTDCLRRIKAIPSADVVEVVRCRDCKWWKPFNDKMGHCGCEMRHKDFYCQRGVKP